METAGIIFNRAGIWTQEFPASFYSGNSISNPAL